ncbi:tetratricopeptide repeat protein [Candidatus Poribacteria bacterium]|nr:tetratricopeptide repeat protein [Candidatus Poribacteria bacterium]
MHIKNIGPITLIVCFVTMLLQSPVIAQRTAAEYITQGEKLRQGFKIQESLDAFLKAHQVEPNNPDAMWRISRAYVDLAGEESAKEKQKQLYLKAEEYARKGVQIAPNNSRCHTYIALTVGKLAGFEGGKTKIQMSKEVKEEATRAIELDPQNDTAYHILGRWHRDVANLSGLLKTFAKVLYGGLPKASNEEAVECFRKAIEIYPTYINHHLELAKTYQEMKQWDLALEELDTVERLPQIHQSDLEHKQEAKRLRAEIAKERK